MIIAFDGNVFTGKSSLIKALVSLSPAAIIGEQGAFLSAPIPSHAPKNISEAIAIQSHFLDAEQKRSESIQLRQDNFLDRSFVSMAAHVSALAIVTGVDIRTWFIAEIEKRLMEGKIIIPDTFCFVRCGHDAIRQRILTDPLRDTDSLYYEEAYLSAVDSFNDAWSRHVGGVVIDTNDEVPIRLAKTLIRQQTLSIRGDHSSQHICASLRDVFAEISATNRR